MSVQSLRAFPDGVQAVREFFTMFYGSDVIQSEDADGDRVLFHLGTAGKIVAVTPDFLEAFDPVEIREHLAAWNVAHLSRTLERGCRLVVTGDGPQEERD